ncbi:MAG: hypothetical protein J6R82_03505 [Clostridia bacterium]|nr:hypothetical protein [Clostridia bacterium]
MKDDHKTANRQSKRGKGGYQKEWAIALFSLLMATALPALVAMVSGLGRSGSDVGINDHTVICLGRHEGQAEEELTLGRLLALSLAATNGSDTPAASWEAQAILLRSRSLWWMDYCGGVEGKSTRQEGSEGEKEKKDEKSDGNGASVEEKGREGQKGPNASHRPFLCDSPVHGLPYLSHDELLKLWGEEEIKLRLDAAQKAVEKTRGQVLCYEGEVVPALLHHSSGGVTQSVEQLPWLASVSTPEEGKEAICTRSTDEVRHALAAGFGMLLPANSALWELSIQSSADGKVLMVQIGGEQLNGTAVAEALSLPSAAFTVEVGTDTLTFVCKGEGSGCGLSRAGAAIYAAGGLTCGEILAHYYPDCTIGIMGR